MILRSLSLALLLVPASALAADLNDLVVGWTNTTSGQDGSDGVDEARDVVVTAANEVIVVGYVDGAANHDKDAFAINYELDGTSNWDLTIDTGDETVATIPGSNDRINSIAVEPAIGTMAWCGVRGQDDSAVDADVQDWYWLALHEILIPNSTTPPTVDFEVYARDGNGTVSPTNACTSLDYRDDIITGGGWSSHSAFGGRWFNRIYSDSTGFLTGALFYSDNAVEEPSVPDRAYAVARDDDGWLAVVGTRGFSGSEGSNSNNTDWYVRVFNDTNALQWEDTFQGEQNLEDVALGVAFDPSGSRNDLVVVGSTNGGSNNTNNSDRDWLVISYSVNGDGKGGANRNWTASFGADSNADEVATAVVYDEDDNILVTGSARDSVSGNEVWRVVKYNKLDGSVFGGQEWIGADWGGDSRPNAIDTRGGRVFVAGTVDDGTDVDFAATMLEIDSDSDGVSDSVDECPFDPDKFELGVCGCNSPDSDFDGDGTANCIDECPTDPNKTERGICPCEAADVDTDKDGQLDCLDECPNDPDKTRLGECGCGAPDDDDDGDGIINCYDGCLETPKGADVDEFGCSGEVDDTGGPSTDGNTDNGGGGSGSCNSAGPNAPIGVLLALGCLIALRRRSASGR